MIVKIYKIGDPVMRQVCAFENAVVSLVVLTSGTDGMIIVHNESSTDTDLTKQCRGIFSPKEFFAVSVLEEK